MQRNQYSMLCGGERGRGEGRRGGGRSEGEQRKGGKGREGGETAGEEAHENHLSTPTSLVLGVVEIGAVNVTHF